MPNPVQKKKTATPTVKPAFPYKIVGLFLILFISVYTWFNKCPSSAQYVAIYSMLGIGSSAFFYNSARRTRLSFKSYNFNVLFFDALAVLAAVFVYNPIDRQKGTGCDTSTSVTVFVHGEHGRQDIVLKDQGTVIMDLQGERKEESINEKGQAVFHNLHVGDKVLLNINFSRPYKSICPDSTYTVTPEASIYLPVLLKGIDKVHGVVLYNEKPLPEVTVKIDDLSCQSDETGHYTISIPKPLQADEYKVWFIKKGFKAKSVKSLPETGELIIVMEK